MTDHRNDAPPFVEEVGARKGELTKLVANAEPTLAVALARAEIDTQVATARAYPRAIGNALNDMTTMATMNPAIAEDCIYSLPRGGKQIRGPSIRFAEIARAAWGNSRDGARVVHVDRIERVVECEAMYHDLQSNVATTSTVRRTIELKRGKQTIDADMVQLAGAAGMSIARRNAILGGIPRFIWQQALDQVEKVVRGDLKTLGERRDRAIAYFAKANISIDRLLKALNKPSADDLDLDDLVTMTGWRTAIMQGDSSLDEIFPEERKPSAKKDLAGQLAALAGEGDDPGAPPSNGSSPTVSEGGAASNQAPAEAKAAGQTPAADAAPNSAAGGQDAKAASPAPAQADHAAGAPPSRADKAAERRKALIAKGEDVASHGHDALMLWLDNLTANEEALVTPALQAAWLALAEGK